MPDFPYLSDYNSLPKTTDIFAVSPETDDIFAYAMPAPLAPKPAITARIKPPAAGSAMKPILPTLGKPAKLPSPIPPAAAVPTPSPHPEVPSKPQVPKAMRAGNIDTIQQRLPRPPKPRYRLQVPMEEAYNRAHDEIQHEMNSVSHPEDKERYQEAIDDLEKVFVSGSERLMTRFLEDHVGWKTFNHLVQSLKDEEPTMTSKKGLYSRTDEHNREEMERLIAGDIFRYAEPGPAKTVKAPELPPDEKPTVKGPAATPPKPPTRTPLRTLGLHETPAKPLDPWWHDVPHTNWLRHADEIRRQPLEGSGINSASLIHLAGEHPQASYRAIWKARDDDQTALARPQTIPEGNPHGHEAAAWELAHLIGLGNMVPPTVSKDNRGQIGSAQHFVAGQMKAVNSPNPFGPLGNKQWPLAAAYDALTMNTDRHMKNWLVDPKSGELTLIDHGLSFPHTHSRELKGTSEILGKALTSGIPVPKEAVQWTEQWPHIERSLKRNGLTDEQIAFTQSRLASLADAAKNGETFADWVTRSGLGSNYRLRGASL